MSYVHEGATDKALAELEKMAAIAEAGRDLAALAGDHNQMGDMLLEAGRVGRGRDTMSATRSRPWTRPTWRRR